MKTALTVLFGLIAVPALADGPVYVSDPEPQMVTTPYVAAGVDWSGVYAGVDVGYGNITVENTMSPPGEGNGPMYGVLAGYNYDLGNYVVGAELGYSLTGIEARDIAVIFDTDYVFDLKARLGYEVGSTLIYGVGGYSEVRVSNPFGPETADFSGYVLGVGADYQLTDSMAIGGEYLYRTLTLDGFSPDPVDMTVQSLRARVTFSF